MNIGDIFPDVLGTDSEGRDVKLSDFPGKRFIVYFYPKDNTPGCTAEDAASETVTNHGQAKAMS